MTRKQKDVVSYFPHDANASTSDTLAVLQNRFGNDGYAFWFKLLEKLAATNGHYVDCRNPMKWQLLLVKTGVNDITGVDIMDLLVEMKAVDKTLWALKVIWCENLVENVSEVYKNRRRELPQKPIITSSKAITTEKKAITTGGKPQSKVKESKVKESRVEEDGGTDKEPVTDFTIKVGSLTIGMVPATWWAELLTEYKDIDHIAELRGFADYWFRGNRKGPKNLCLSLRNWFTKAREFNARGNGAKGKAATPNELKTGWG